MIWKLLAAAGVTMLAAAQIDELRLMPVEDPAIDYAHASVQDRVAALQQKLDRGEIKLKSDSEHGYLEAVLKALDVPVASQVLVFSKTSFQSPKIGPRLPRAIYHSDDVAVGWVQTGDVVEIASVDPLQGTVFYTLDQGESAHPTFVRRGECMQCHIGASTLGTPGLVVRSVHVDHSGGQILAAHAYITDHRSPLEHRWGGWYVTGKTGTQRHMGNQTVENPGDADEMDLGDGTNILNLRPYFDTGAYLRADSDIVSLMVLEHQTRMVNLITRLGWETRLGDGHAEATVEALVKYMTFAEETALKAPIEGNEEYAREFTRLGPRDRQGRSLREFDLKTRMFRFPCSFLIYSAQFDGLPPAVLRKVYGRLRDVLTARDASPDRKAAWEILLETKPAMRGLLN